MTMDWLFTLSFWQQIYPVSDKTFINNSVTLTNFLTQSSACPDKSQYLVGYPLLAVNAFIRFGIDSTSCNSKLLGHDCTCMHTDDDYSYTADSQSQNRRKTGQYCIYDDKLIQISERTTKYCNKIIQQTYKKHAVHCTEDYIQTAATNRADKLNSINYSS